MALPLIVQTASQVADDLRKYLKGLPEGAPRTSVMIKQVATGLMEVKQARDNVSADIASKELVPDDEANWELLFNIDLLYLSTAATWADDLAAAKKAAQEMLYVLDDLRDGFADVIKDQGLGPYLDFLQKRAQLILSYQSTDNKSPDWNGLVGGPFWQYPPRQSGTGWLLGLGALAAAIAYWRSK